MNDSGIIFRENGISLHVSYQTLEVWKKLRQTKANTPERFGIIVGFRSEGEDEYWVESVTTPFFKDKSTKYSFLMQDKAHQKVADIAFKMSGGTSIYLGTWHTHPERIPHPSGIDLKDWKSCMKRNPSRQLFFVIVGLKDIHVYIKNDFGFSKLKRVTARNV